MRDHLISLVENDKSLARKLALSGELFQGYHPTLKALHEANARELELLIDDEGWPTEGEVGADGALAAFHIALNAISRPSFLRRCLTLLKAGARRGEIPAWQAATLEDRIRVMEGRPQIYGTQIDWDADGHLAPLPIAAEDDVDARRARVGLPPLAQSLAAAQLDVTRTDEHPPAEWLHRRQAMDEFARATGWR